MKIKFNYVKPKISLSTHTQSNQFNYVQARNPGTFAPQIHCSPKPRYVCPFRPGDISSNEFKPLCTQPKPKPETLVRLPPQIHCSPKPRYVCPFRPNDISSNEFKTLCTHSHPTKTHFNTFKPETLVRLPPQIHE